MLSSTSTRSRDPGRVAAIHFVRHEVAETPSRGRRDVLLSIEK